MLTHIIKTNKHLALFGSVSKVRKFKKRYVFLRDTLGLEVYQRLSLEAKYQITKYAMENNMPQADKHALRNVVISISPVSKKIKVLDGSIEENIVRTNNQPKILYIGMDEIYVDLQFGVNVI